jgi:murein L,D-transpeptidase YafK
MGDKRHQGDQATPEGYYKITEKKDGTGTKYYKALLLNYPNEDDLKRFNLEKKKGTLRKSTDIGGSIEIHGNGGKGIDWTNGCIALKDSDMDVVYRISQAGTIVTIVGSLKPLEEIIK